VKKIIVFVDDEKNILSGIKRNLFGKKDIWNIKYFTDGSKALSFIKENNVSLVISDMKMPNMNGFELMEQISTFSPGTIRIILSGHTDDNIAYKSVRIAHQFLSKPIKTELLISTIEKALKYREIVSNTYLSDIVNGLTMIPSLPAIYNEITETLKDEETTFKEIGKIVEKDVGLTVSLLKIANSAFFGINREVKTAIDATMFLGIDVVKNLLLFISVYSKLDQQSLNDMGLSYLWDHSLLVAKISKDIAIYLGMDKNKSEICYTAGLLHDLGRLILATNFPEDYKSIIELDIENATFLTVEKEIFGANHAMVGAYLASIWGLPIDIVNSIWCHHDIQNCELNCPSLESIVYISNIFYHKIKEIDISFIAKEYNEEIIIDLGFSENLEELENIARKVIES